MPARMLETDAAISGSQWHRPSLTDGFSRLPPEIALQILSHLSFEDLLSFGATCRLNQEYHIVSLKRLRLGVFEKRRHPKLSLLGAEWTSPEESSGFCSEPSAERSYTISIVESQSRSTKEYSSLNTCQTSSFRQRNPTRHDKPRTLEQMVRIQNQILSRVLRRYGKSLRYLEFMAYDITLEGATALGSNCTYTLRHLALRFEHTHIREGMMRPKAWLQPAPANEAWNALIGIGRFKNSGLYNLETLILERAGITSWQLMRLVKSNPDLTTLKLRTCRGARPDFLYWLGGMENDLDEAGQEDGIVPGAKLEVLSLEHCHRLLEHPIDEDEERPDETCDSGFEWVRNLANVKSLSFSQSEHLPSTLIDRANKMIWKIPNISLPFSAYDGNASIAVDPMYLPDKKTELITQGGSC
ncbi:hypothetical protein BDV18DRAFT_146467 [Aspergillus unguis]